MATSMIRQALSRAFPSMEREMANSVGKELRAMDEFATCMKPEVYSYLSLSAAGYSSAAGGAFGRSGAIQAPAKLVRVTRPVESRGLFHE
eukprot:CAMPEP_0172414020 /NCGR_PEP_ID=MMETSP1064-20121228/638_1 /TAXON_ID=202472 /ORGANISM="Aulacoseira subarctica , Strain CCAP 1002/5" /LENGTH=89 /DNA_ID=CAMNT_0013150481 /DNA_START=106 /DNA_END=375 /DNA_ORIENTATION=+